MKLYSLRLGLGEDLRLGIMEYARHEGLRSGSIVTCVGALDKFRLRMAGATPDGEDVRDYSEPHEIVSLVGTVTEDDCHLHISLSDLEGNVVGGHLKAGSYVSPTAEIVIVEHEDVEYLREMDEKTGFEELVVKRVDYEK